MRLFVPSCLSAFALAFALSSSLGAQQADRSKPPAIGPASALKLPPIVKRTLANGLHVWVIGVHMTKFGQHKDKAWPPIPRGNSAWRA